MTAQRFTFGFPPPEDIRILGMGLDMLSDNAPIIEATGFELFDFNARWLAEVEPNLGDMVTDGGPFTVLETQGISTGGLDNFVLYGTITVEATELGSTNLSFAENSLEISDGSQSVADQIGTFGTGVVNVSAVPEPSSFAALGLAACGLVGASIYRRRRNKKAA